MFYGIDDVSALSGVFFFERATCLFAYQGALRSVLETQLMQQREEEEAWKKRFGGSQNRAPLGSKQSFSVNGPEDVRGSDLNGLIEFA